MRGRGRVTPRSRRPTTSPTAIPATTLELIIRLRKELTEAGLDAGAGWRGACLVVGWVDAAVWLRVTRLTWLAEGREGAGNREAQAGDHVAPVGPSPPRAD